MSKNDYVPWRRNGEPDEMLETQVSEAWQSMLDDSKRCVEALRAATREADQRLGLGRRLLEALTRRQPNAHELLTQQLARFEHRLKMMESRLNQVELESPSTLPHPSTRRARNAA